MADDFTSRDHGVHNRSRSRLKIPRSERRIGCVLDRELDLLCYFRTAEQGRDAESAIDACTHTSTGHNVVVYDDSLSHGKRSKAAKQIMHRPMRRGMASVQDARSATE